MINQRQRILKPVVIEESDSLLKVCRKIGESLFPFGKFDRSLQVAQGVVITANHQIQAGNRCSEAKFIAHIAGVFSMPKSTADFLRTNWFPLQDFRQTELSAARASMC